MSTTSISPVEINAMVYIEGLTQRINTHSAEQKAGFEKLDRKLDQVFTKLEDIQRKAADEKFEIYQAINAVKEMAMQDNHKLSVKVALLTGAIGIISGGAGSLAVNLIRAAMQNH